MFGFGGTGETEEEIYEKIASSECSHLFAATLSQFFSPGDEHYQWMMAGHDRMYRIAFSTEGIHLIRIEVTPEQLKETGTYDVDAEGYGFGASGYQDLPNRQYVNAFKQYVCSQIAVNCPTVMVSKDGYVKLTSNAKKGW